MERGLILALRQETDKLGQKAKQPLETALKTKPDCSVVPSEELKGATPRSKPGPLEPPNTKVVLVRDPKWELSTCRLRSA